MDLSKKLQTLHDDLGVVSQEELAPETIAKLKELALDIERILVSTNSASTKDVTLSEAATSESLQQRLQHSIDAFEAEHPQLTRVLAIIAERLADMGI